MLDYVDPMASLTKQVYHKMYTYIIHFLKKRKS